MITNNIIKSLELTIPEKTPLIIGCSAGPDSMALLHYLKHNTNNPIICAHINHNLRKESNEEEKYLKNYCKKENITFETTKINKYQENNLENEARKKRYAFYELLLKKYNSSYLFLAHHGDDLIETILMKIERGSNLEGYAGIKEISKKKNYFIIRPFIKYTKQDLLDYNEKHNIKYFIDKTNNDPKYTRNRYRLNILPHLKDKNKNIHKFYLKYSQTILEYNNYIEEEINKQLKNIINNNIININKLKELHPFLQKNILYKILNNIYDNQTNIIKDNHIKNILTLINSNKPNQFINLPQNKIAKKVYNNLYIEDNKKRTINNYKLELKDTNTIGNICIKKVTNEETDGNDICRINSKNINLPLYLRNRKPGDYIFQLGLNGRKKLKEVFIENKIPKEIRDNYPILVDNNDQIIWIPNIKKSKFNSQKDEFCDIILKYCEKEENDE